MGLGTGGGVEVSIHILDYQECCNTKLSSPQKHGVQRSV